MAKIIHISCPTCGGTLGVAGMERVVKCRYCENWALVDGAEIVPEYWVSPRLNQQAARRHLQKFLMDPEFPEGLLKASAFDSARLYFVPFYEFNARRLGTITTRTEKLAPKKLTTDYVTGPQGSVHVVQKWERAKIPGEIEIDTRVIMNDVFRIEPAVRLNEWSLDEAELPNLRNDPQGKLEPINRKLMERQGKVFDASINPGHILKLLTMQAPSQTLTDRTEFAETRVKRVFYPVWRVKYRYQGRPYGATFDAVTGKLMAGRAPRNDKHRILWLLGAVAPVALFGGRILRLAGLTMIFGASHIQAVFAVLANFGVILIPLAFVLLMMAVTVVGIGWDSFRYPGEVLVKGASRTVVRINRPERTVFDKMHEALDRILDHWRRGVEDNLKGGGY